MAAQHARAKGVRLITCVCDRGLVCELQGAREHERTAQPGLGSQDLSNPQ
jgi:hypothetical protein